MTTAIDILDTLEKELDIKKFNESSLYGAKIDCAQHYIREAKSRIQALWDGWIKPNWQDLVKWDVLAIDYQWNCHIWYLVPYERDPWFYCQWEETVLDDVKYYQIIIPPNK